MSGVHVIRKQLKGGARWYVYAYRGGPQIHVCDGPRPVITRDLLALALAATQTPTHSDNIATLIREYENSPEYLKRRESTRKNYDALLRRIHARFGDTPLEIFEDRRIRRKVLEWRDSFADTPRTADALVGMLSTLLGFGVERAILAINAAAAIPKLHHATRSELIWEESHYRQWLSNFKKARKVHRPLWDAIQFARMTGFRLSDLVKVTWADVGEHSIVITTQKRQGRAAVPIVPELRKWLDRRPHRAGPLLLSTNGKQWTPDGLKTAFQRHKPKDFDRRLHDLRGSFVTWLATKGLTDSEIARCVGWTAERIGEIRARYVDDARVVIEMSRRLAG